jgi:hypothetical protein
VGYVHVAGPVPDNIAQLGRVRYLIDGREMPTSINELTIKITYFILRVWLSPNAVCSYKQV